MACVQLLTSTQPLPHFPSDDHAANPAIAPLNKSPHRNLIPPPHPRPRRTPRQKTRIRQQMRSLASPDASVPFTNISSAASASLSAAFAAASSFPAPTLAQGECHDEGVLGLMQACGIAREQVCLLNLKAPMALSPSDADAGTFTWFLFGVRLPSPVRQTYPLF